MRILGILLLFSNLVCSLVLWAGISASPIDSSIQSTLESPQPDISLQQGSIPEFGEALPNSIIPQRPVARTFQYLFEIPSHFVNFSGFSSICHSEGRDYQKLAKTLNRSLPPFLIVFPHHYFT